MFGKKAAEDKEFQKEINSNHKVDDVFNKQYYYVDKSVACGGKRPVLVRDDNGKEYMYRVLDSYSKIYENLHKNPINGVPEIIEIVKADRKTHIIEEKVEGVTLYEYGTLTEEQAYNLILQLCDILEELHSRNIVHNDIKPSNIMLESLGDSKEEAKLWLIDFDGSKFIDRSKLARLESQKMPETEERSSIILTERYATVEQIQGCSVEETDLSLLGQTFLDVLPFDYDGKLKNALEKCTDPNYKVRYKNVKILKQAIRIAKFPYNPIEWINFKGVIGGEVFFRRLMIYVVLNILYDNYFDLGAFIKMAEVYQLGIFKTALLSVYPFIWLLKYSTFAKRFRDLNKSAWLCGIILAFDLWSFDFGTFSEIFPRIRYTVDIVLLSLLTAKK